MDTKVTLEWMVGLCESVTTARNQGNYAPLNRLYKNPAAKHFYDNVHCLGAISPENWARQYHAHLLMLEDTRLDYVAQEQAVTHEKRLESLEAKIGSIADQLKAFLEAQAPKKPGRKPALKEDETPAEPTDEDQDEEGQTTPAAPPAEETPETEPDQDKAD